MPDYGDFYEACTSDLLLEYQQCLNHAAGQELIEAAAANDICWAQNVLQRYDIEPDVNLVENATGFSALHFASIHLNIRMIQLLFDNGAVLCGQQRRAMLQSISALNNSQHKNYYKVQALLDKHSAPSCH